VESRQKISPSGNITILSTAFLPPVEWFRAAALSSCTLIEGCESYQKQSYRNRCRISTAGGIENLNVPTVHSDSKKITDIRIDYSEPWVQRIERALVAAYNSSPFFLYYRDEIIPLLKSGEENLFEYNMALIRVLAELLGVKINFGVTESFLSDYPASDKDYRFSIHPKKTLPEELALQEGYYQVFREKFGFIPSLSALDLLFNEGPNAVTYLLRTVEK